MAKIVIYLAYYHSLKLKVILFKTSVICIKGFEKLLHNNK